MFIYSVLSHQEHIFSHEEPARKTHLPGLNFPEAKTNYIYTDILTTKAKAVLLYSFRTHALAIGQEMDQKMSIQQRFVATFQRNHIKSENCNGQMLLRSWKTINSTKCCEKRKQQQKRIGLLPTIAMNVTLGQGIHS